MKYTLEYEIDNYSPGQYLVEEQELTKEAARVFAHHIQYLEKIYDYEGYIDVKLYGATDGLPIRSRFWYEGEFGDIKNKKYIFDN